MATIGSASLAITPSFADFQSKLEGGTGKALTAAGASGGTKFGDAAGKSMSSKFTGYAKTAAKAGALALAGVGVAVLKIGADSIQAASDLDESTNKVQQVFGKGAERVFNFAEKAADKFGQTNQQARDAAATFGIFGRVAKLSGKENAKFAVGMTKLASDLASFNNTSPEQAIEAIGAALRGEAEPIRAYGVLLDEASLKAEALSMGILKPVKDQAKIKTYQVAVLDGQKKYNEAVAEYGAKSLEALKAEAALGTSRDRLTKATEGSIPPLTAQQKVMAAQSSIMKQTAIQQGDFARTSDGLANSQRRLTARWEDAKAALGKALLPTVNKFVKFLLDKGIPAVEGFADWFNQDGIDNLKKFGGGVKTVAGHAKDLAKFLNDLPAPAKIAGLTALFGGIAAAKLRGGKGGVLGTAGKVLGLTKPLPVFVTNPGFGAGGAPGGKGIPPVIGGLPANASKAAKFGSKLRGIAPILPAAGAYGNDRLPKMLPTMTDAEIERWKSVNAEAGKFADATRKLPNQMDIGKTAAQGLLSEILKIDRSDPKVEYRAPGFDELLRRTREYDSLLDGLNNRLVTTIMQTRYVKNDPGEGGGTNPQPPGRSGPGGVTVIHNGDIKSDSPRDYLRNTQRLSRHRSGGGVTFP